jgi:RNA polymerase sigma factor (sigma-70 family)
LEQITQGRGHEQELVLEASAGPGDARDALIELFTPRIAAVARTYHGSAAVSRAELMQDGVVGLLHALERYDPAFGTPFWAYARWWVRQAMQQLVAELARPVVLSDRAARELARVKAEERSHRLVHGHDASADQLAAGTGLDRAHVEALRAAERAPDSLEGVEHVDPGGEEGYERAELAALLSDLPVRECAVVRARFGLDGRVLTLRELGRRIGVSAECVRQIEGRALERLRRAAPA